MFNAIENFVSVKKKADFCFKYMDKSICYSKRVFAFLVIEGVFFSSSFCAIFWLKKRGGKMKGLTFSNELISRDEGLHASFAALMFRKFRDTSICDEEFLEIMREAIEIEREFVEDCLSTDLLGINAQSMFEYV
jgi:ribonucleoside-diphosphate reductase beta chain